MTKAETVDDVYIEQFIQKRINKLSNRIKGGNTFICCIGKIADLTRQ